MLNIIGNFKECLLLMYIFACGEHKVKHDEVFYLDSDSVGFTYKIDSGFFAGTYKVSIDKLNSISTSLFDNR